MVISLFYPHCGGAEQQALNLARGLISSGFSVSILTRRTGTLASYEKIQGVPVYRSIRTVPWGKLFGLTYMLTVFLFLHRMRHSYDIIHCHLAQGFHSPVSLLVRALFKKKIVIKIGATGPLSDFKMLQRVLLGNFFLRLLRHADRIITVCGQATVEARTMGIPFSSIEQIPNGVDTDLFRPLSDRKKNSCITFVGRLDYMKGVHVLLQAFQLLKQKNSDACLQIIGNGPEREPLKKMAQEFGISDSVVFCGEVQDVAPRLQQSAALVLPSLSEGLSNVVLEAMACGLPVVATRAGGTVDLINDGVSGILVEPERADTLCEALYQILSDTTLAQRLGAEARRVVEKQFSLQTIVSRYIQLYTKQLSGLRR